LGEYEVVLAWQAEAAIAAAEKRGYDSGLIKSLTIADCYEQGQRDMLAKCIAAVRAVGGGYSVPLGMSVSAFIDAMRHQFIAALHDLEETL
jgi:hypothetical protein